MKTPLPTRFFLVLVALTTFASGALAEPPSPAPVSIGNNTYSLMREAKNAFQRDIALLKSQAQEDAQRFCASQGKQMKVLELTTEKPWFALGFAKAKIVFQALPADDPALQTPTKIPPVASESGPRAITNTTDLYNELMRLDELHKKGILSDDEFQAEKQKVLARSK